MTPPTMEITLDDSCGWLFCVLCSVGRLVEAIEVERSESEPAELSGPSELVEGTVATGWLDFELLLLKVVLVDTFIGSKGTELVELPGSDTVEWCDVHLSGLPPARLATTGSKVSLS